MNHTGRIPRPEQTHEWASLDDQGRAQATLRAEAADVVDAVATYLVGEPIGYALLDCDGEPFCNIDGLDDARDYAQWLNEPKSGDFNRPYRVVALVPVDTP